MGSKEIRVGKGIRDFVDSKGIRDGKGIRDSVGSKDGKGLRDRLMALKLELLRMYNMTPRHISFRQSIVTSW